MSRRMGESWYEDWDQVVEFACVLAPDNSDHALHEAHAWLELFFDLASYSKKDELVQLEALRREVASLFSWVWGDPANSLLVVFDCESAADRAHHLHRAGVIGYMGQIGHLPPLPRCDPESQTEVSQDDSPHTRKWLKDCCARIKYAACSARDRILYRHYDVTEYHQSGKQAFPFFEEAGLYATAVDLASVPEHATLREGVISDPVKGDDERMEAAFSVFLAMLMDEGFPVSRYRLSLSLFEEAEKAFRDSVEPPTGVDAALPGNDKV